MKQPKPRPRMTASRPMPVTPVATFCVKPAAGLTVRDPVTFRPLAAEGEQKPKYAHEMYWMRRLRDGDVVLVTAEPANKGTE